MKLNRLKSVLQERKMSPEMLAKISEGDFSNMSVRRAKDGGDIHPLIARAIAKTLKVKLEELQ